MDDDDDLDELTRQAANGITTMTATVVALRELLIGKGLITPTEFKEAFEFQRLRLESELD